MGRLKGHSLVPVKLLNKDMTVFDVIYTPALTQLLLDTRSAGGTPISGDIMFLGQGVRQFELWSGQPAPLSVMREAFKAQL